MWYILGFLKIRGSWQATIVLMVNDVAFETQKATLIQCNRVKICEFDWNGNIMFYSDSRIHSHWKRSRFIMKSEKFASILFCDTGLVLAYL